MTAERAKNDDDGHFNSLDLEEDFVKTLDSVLDLLKMMFGKEIDSAVRNTSISTLMSASLATNCLIKKLMTIKAKSGIRKNKLITTMIVIPLSSRESRKQEKLLKSLSHSACLHDLWRI